MKTSFAIIFLATISSSIIASDIDVTKDRYVVYTAEREISLFEEDGGAIVLESDKADFSCYLNRKEIDNPTRYIIPKGTQIVIGELVENDSSETYSSKTWNIPNSDDLNSFSCESSNGALPSLKELVQMTMDQEKN